MRAASGNLTGTIRQVSVDTMLSSFLTYHDVFLAQVTSAGSVVMVFYVMMSGAPCVQNGRLSWRASAGMYLQLDSKLALHLQCATAMREIPTYTCYLRSAMRSDKEQQAPL